MKSINELLRLVKEYTSKHIEDQEGLCSISGFLRAIGVITAKEEDKFDNYLEKNRPDNIYKKRGSSYYWERGVSQGRMRWLNKHIKLTENENS